MYSAISVIVPTFNRDHFLRRCLNSVIKTLQPIDEVIVVDTGTGISTDRVVADIGDERIRYVREDDKGVSAARNIGMKLARHDLIAFIDDDDEWHPRKLEVQRRLMEMHPEVVGCFTNIWATDADGNRMPNYLFQWGQPVQDWNKLLGESKSVYLEGTDDPYQYFMGDHYFNQMLDDYILPSSLLINRARFQEPLEFRVGMQRNESWLFTSQVCRQGPVIYVDFDLACHHGDAPNRLTTIPRVETVLSRLFVLRNEFGKNSDFLAIHEKEYQARLQIEATKLLRSTMAKNVSDRRGILADNADLGGIIVFAAKLPDSILALLSTTIRVYFRGCQSVSAFIRRQPKAAGS